MDAAVEVRLPGGVWREGACARDARLRALGPEEERSLVDAAEEISPAQFATAALGRALVAVGGVSAEGEETARELTIGDRQALLLHLRRITVGESMSCVFSCPMPECGEQLELDLRVDDLLVDAEGPDGQWHEVQEGGDRARFRLPTGADQERAARTALAEGVEASVRELLATCAEGEAADWPAELHDRVIARMSELDPQAELTLALTCPVCERTSSVPLDLVAYLRDELRDRVGRLEREVHALASAYGWGEEEILAMPPGRRRRYLVLVETGGRS
jgi:hypothetical protein